MNVAAAASADGIELSWSPDRDSAVVSYRVYRGANESGPFELLETVRKPTSRYHDRNAAVGDVAIYRMTALDENGVESAATQLAVTRPGLWRWTSLGSKQLLYVALAAGLYFVVGRIDYRRLGSSDRGVIGSPVFWVLLVATSACVLVLIPGIGTAINGARRWIKLGPVQIQPSELAKWGAVLFTAWWLTRPQTDVRRFIGGFLPVVVAVGVLCLLVVIQDFGTAALIGLCILTMLLAGRVKLWHIALFVIPAIAGAVWFIADKEYRLRRILAFRDPYASPQGEGYHMIQSLLSFTTGGITGRGLGNGVQKLGYLPEDTTDFVFAVICEELGLGGALLVVLLYLGILLVAWETMRRKRDDFGRLLAFGVAAMVGLQAAINIAVATVSVPTKGLSLPLVSAGGSGMVITCAALGLLYSVTRHSRAVTPPESVADENFSSASDRNCTSTGGHGSSQAGLVPA